jgi:hypothetical protein
MRPRIMTSRTKNTKWFSADASPPKILGRAALRSNDAAKAKRIFSMAVLSN